MSTTSDRRRPPRGPWITLCTLLLCTGVPAAELDDLRALWRSGEYAQALPGLLDYLERPYGRAPEVIAMTASCACRIGGDWAPIGTRFFAVLSDWDLGKKGRRWLQRESHACAEATGPPREFLTAGATRTLNAAAGVTGKMFYAWTGEQNMPVLDDSAGVVRHLDPSLFQARLFASDHASAAIESFAQLEREVTGEGIRDKIAASKRKGL